MKPLAGWPLVVVTALLTTGGVLLLLLGDAASVTPGVGLLTAAAGLVVPSQWKKDSAK